jgi:CO dehydrogenase/acetyl-CoA synthase beta subunit
LRTPFTIAELKKSACSNRNDHLFTEAVKPKRSKYNNVKVEFDGIIFDSHKECNRYINLRALQVAGEIKDLRCQVEYIIERNGKKLCSYISDFVYTDKSGAVIVEDVKSPATRRLAVYRLKKKLMLEHFQVEIKEV